MRLLTAIALLVLASAAPAPVFASHSTGEHWPDGTVVKVLDSTTGDGYGTKLRASVDDWNRAAGVQMHVVERSGTGSDCPYPDLDDRIRVCDGHYAPETWAGYAQSYQSGDHYLRGRIRFNLDNGYSDSYVRHLTCHELGHLLGLGHVDGGSSCMVPGENTWYPTDHDIAAVERNHDHRHSSSLLGDFSAPVLVGRR